jgi:hypothetical protein
MIRRDYILQMIEEFARALARINSLKAGQRWNEAAEELDVEFKKLVGEGAPALARLSETELLARLMREGPTQALRDKTLILTTLLKEAGDVAAAQGQAEAGRGFYLKALHLLLEVLGGEARLEYPEFVPKVEMLVAALEPEPLPVHTQAMLMHHYEQTEQYARAEDALYTMLEAEPDNAKIVEFGIAFYRRLLSQSDAALSEANLPRAEAEEGLKELQGRRKGGAN